MLFFAFDWLQFDHKNRSLELGRISRGYNGTFWKRNIIPSRGCETDTEKTLKQALEDAKNDGLDGAIQEKYDALVLALNRSKTSAIDSNKDYILQLLTEEIVKRYGYREGLYNYFKIHNPEIKKAVQILGSPTAYLEYLR